jgi:hypothetical protein
MQIHTHGRPKAGSPTDANSQGVDPVVIGASCPILGRNKEMVVSGFKALPCPSFPFLVTSILLDLAQNRRLPKPLISLFDFRRIKSYFNLLQKKKSKFHGNFHENSDNLGNCPSYQVHQFRAL